MTKSEKALFDKEVAEGFNAIRDVVKLIAQKMAKRYEMAKNTRRLSTPVSSARTSDPIRTYSTRTGSTKSIATTSSLPPSTSTDPSNAIRKRQE